MKIILRRVSFKNIDEYSHILIENNIKFEVEGNDMIECFIEKKNIYITIQKLHISLKKYIPFFDGRIIIENVYDDVIHLRILDDYL